MKLIAISLLVSSLFYSVHTKPVGPKLYWTNGEAAAMALGGAGAAVLVTEAALAAVRNRRLNNELQAERARKNPPYGSNYPAFPPPIGL